MSDNKRNINSSIGKTLDYLRNLLGGQERNALERNLERDPFEKDAMEGFQSISPEDLEADIKQIKRQLTRRVNRSNRILIYRVAAGIAIILTLSISYLVVFDKQIDEFPENLQVSERVENEDLVSDKSSDLTTESSQIKQLASNDDETSESEFKAYNTEDDLDTRIIVSEPVGAAAEMGPKEKSGFLNLAENTVEFTMELDEEVEIQVEEFQEVFAFQHLEEESVSVKSEIISEPMAEVSETEFALQKADSRSKKAAASTTESREEIVVADEQISVAAQPNAFSGVSLEEVVIVGLNEKRETTNLSTDYIPARPEIGMRNYSKYIEENIRIPEGHSDINKAVVVLKFIVNEKGNADHIRIIESPDTTFSIEAIRLVKDGPVWFPAKRSGVYSDEETRLKIVFKN